MELLTLEIIFLLIIVVILLFIFRKHKETSISRNELLHKLQKEYDTVVVNKTNDVNLPEIEFTKEGRKFHIYNTLIRRRRYMNIYNEYLEITNFGRLESERIMTNAKSILDASAERVDDKIIIDISSLKDYQLLLSYFKNYNR